MEYTAEVSETLLSDPFMEVVISELPPVTEVAAGDVAAESDKSHSKYAAALFGTPVGRTLTQHTPCTSPRHRGRGHLHKHGWGFR